MKHIFSIAELDDLCKRFPDPNHFIGSVFQNCESETIVIQTLHASRINMKDHQDHFSFRSEKVLVGPLMDGGVDNGSAYVNLLSGGYLLEERVKAKELRGKIPEGLKPDAEGFVTLVFITDRLFHTLMAHQTPTGSCKEDA